jgi:hypothetical protein
MVIFKRNSKLISGAYAPGMYTTCLKNLKYLGKLIRM